MKKSLTALFALLLAFAFGTATLAYAETPAAKDETAAAAKKEMKTEKKEKKKVRKHVKKKVHKKEMKKEEKKEEMNK
jgi:ABC-type transporter MlaC component